MFLRVLRHTAVALRLPPDRRPAFASWFQIADIAHLLATPVFRGVWEQRLAQDPCGTVQPVAQLFQHAPLECPAGERGGVARPVHMQMCLGVLLGFLCSLLEEQQQQPGSHLLQLDTRRRLAHQLLPAIPRLAPALQLFSQKRTHCLPAMSSCGHCAAPCAAAFACWRLLQCQPALPLSAWPSCPTGMRLPARACAACRCWRGCKPGWILILLVGRQPSSCQQQPLHTA